MWSLLGALFIFVLFFNEIQISSGMFQTPGINIRSSKEEDDRRAVVATPRLRSEKNSPKTNRPRKKIFKNEESSGSKEKEDRFDWLPIRSLRKPGKRIAKILAEANKEKECYDPLSGLTVSQMKQISQSSLPTNGYPHLTLAEHQMVKQHHRQYRESYNSPISSQTLHGIPHSHSTYPYFPVSVGNQAPHEGRRQDQQNLHSSLNAVASYDEQNQNPEHPHKVSNPSALNPFESPDWQNPNHEGHYGGSSSSWGQGTNDHHFENPGLNFGIVNDDQFQYNDAALQAHLEEICPENLRAVEYVNQYYASQGRVSGSDSGTISHYQK